MKKKENVKYYKIIHNEWPHCIKLKKLLNLFYQILQTFKHFFVFLNERVLIHTLDRNDQIEKKNQKSNIKNQKSTVKTKNQKPNWNENNSSIKNKSNQNLISSLKNVEKFEFFSTIALIKIFSDFFILFKCTYIRAHRLYSQQDLYSLPHPPI